MTGHWWYLSSGSELTDEESPVNSSSIAVLFRLPVLYFFATGLCGCVTVEVAIDTLEGETRREGGSTKHPL